MPARIEAQLLLKQAAIKRVAVTAVLALAGGLTITRMHDDTVTPAHRSPDSSITSFPKEKGDDLWLAQLPVGAPAQVDVVSGDSIYTADRRRIRIDLPAGHELWNAARAVGGWVADSGDENGSSRKLWYVSSSCQTLDLGGTGGAGWKVENGGLAVIAGGDDSDSNTFRRIFLPDGEVTAQISSNAFHSAIAAVPGFVLVIGGTGGEGPARTAIWDIANEKISESETAFYVNQILPDGKLLATVTKDFGDASDPCLTIVSVTKTTTIDRSELCPSYSLESIHSAALSPDKDRVVLSGWQSNSEVYIVRRFSHSGASDDEVRLPINSDANIRIVRWENSDSILFSVYDVYEESGDWVNKQVFFRCTVSTLRCERAPHMAESLSDHAAVVE